MKVSICTITYNQEKFISQAIESFLSQKTNFDFEIIVSDDASTDNTKEILKSYSKKYPLLVKLVTRSKNVGMMQNLVETLKRCTGEYIAFCEGDDYWTDENKLQKQADFLDANQDYSICFHKIKELDKDGNLTNPIMNNFDKNITYNFLEIAEYNVIHSPSVMWRGSIIDILPYWILQAPLGDFILHLLYANRGKTYFMSDTMAIYRKHPQGVWSQNSAFANMVKLKWVVDKMDDYFSFKYHNAFYSKRFLEDYYLTALEHFNSSRDFKKYFHNLFLFFKCRKKVNRSFGNIILLARQYFYTINKVVI